MKNFRLYPFEKNRYFTGKKINVRDYEAEQEYFNNKLYLNNRLIHGSGIVSGLQVSCSDGEVIVIEPGVALDCYGREIVVSSQVTKRLSDIEGAPAKPAAKSVGLYLEYLEDPRESVQVPASACCDEACEYNRIREVYALHIRDTGNAAACRDSHYLHTETQNIYNDGEYKISRITPRWVNPNELFKVKLVLERTVQKQGALIVIEEKPGTDFVFHDNSDSLVIFPISTSDTGTRFEKEYLVRTLPDTAEDTINNTIQCKSVQLYLGNIDQDTGRLAAANTKSDKEAFLRNLPEVKKLSNQAVISGTPLTSQVDILDMPVSRRIIDAYFSRDTRSCGSYPDSGYVFLAELQLKDVNRANQVARVIPPGYSGYVYNNPFLYELLSDMEMRITTNQYPLEVSTASPQVINTASARVSYTNPKQAPGAEVKYIPDLRDLSFDFHFPKDKSSGLVRFDIESDHLEAEDYGISESIDPGFGAGPVFVQVNLEQSRYSKLLEPYDRIAYGVVSNPATGTFRIWYRAMARTAKIHSLHFRWMAFNNVHDKGEAPARRFTLTPKRKVYKTDGSKAVEVTLNQNYKGPKKQGKPTITWEFLSCPEEIPLTKAPRRKRISRGKVISGRRDTSRVENIIKDGKFTIPAEVLNNVTLKEDTGSTLRGTFTFTVKCTYKVADIELFDTAVVCVCIEKKKM